MGGNLPVGIGVQGSDGLAGAGEGEGVAEAGWAVGVGSPSVAVIGGVGLTTSEGEGAGSVTVLGGVGLGPVGVSGSVDVPHD